MNLPEPLFTPDPLAQSAYGRCTCHSAWAGLERPQCPVHGKHWVAPIDMRPVLPTLSPMQPQIDTTSLDYLAGFKAGVEAIQGARHATK